jgi:hypothetical protein
MIRRRQQVLIVAALALGLVRPGLAQEVGNIADLESTTEIGRAGAWTAAVLGAAVREGDEVRTDRTGRARVVLQDGSVLNVGNDSHVMIEKLTLQPDKGAVRSLIRLLKGKLRPVVSDAYLRPGAVFEIETPAAVAGVRGTEFVITYDPVAEVSEVVGVTGTVRVHSVIDRVGHGVLITAQELTFVALGHFPTAPQRIQDTLFRQYIEGLEFIGGGRPESLTLGHPLLAGSQVPPADQAAASPAPPTAARALTPLVPGEPPFDPPTFSGSTGQPPGALRPTGDLGIQF